MRLVMASAISAQIAAHAEAAYPHECCGCLLGTDAADGTRTVTALMPLENARESEEQYHRFLIAPQDTLRAEQTAAEQGLDVVGVYHSHPDHPARPSEFDREHALPWWSYVITTVTHGQAAESRAWRLAEDRQGYAEEELIVGAQVSGQ